VVLVEWGVGQERGPPIPDGGYTTGQDAQPDAAPVAAAAVPAAGQPGSAGRAATLPGHLVDDRVEPAGVLLRHVGQRSAGGVDPNRVGVVRVGGLTDQFGGDEGVADTEEAAATADRLERVLVVALTGSVDSRARVERRELQPRRRSRRKRLSQSVIGVPPRHLRPLA
jgi:hypothetical protein